MNLFFGKSKKTSLSKCDTRDNGVKPNSIVWDLHNSTILSKCHIWCLVLMLEKRKSKHIIQFLKDLSNINLVVKIFWYQTNSWKVKCNIMLILESFLHQIGPWKLKCSITLVLPKDYMTPFFHKVLVLNNLFDVNNFWKD